MAFAVAVNFTFQDSKGKKSKSVLHVPTGFTIAQYLEFATAAGQILANASNGEVTSISLGVNLDLSTATIRAAALSTADIAQKAFFMVRSAVSGLFAKFNIPTLNESDHVVTGSDELDLADADVAALITIYEDGVDIGGSVFIQPCDERENDLESVSQAREIFRKS